MLEVATKHHPRDPALLPPGGSPPASPGEPRPIAGMGYRKTFRDDFDTLNRAVWDDHIWYDAAPSSAWTNFQTVDANGILHLRTSACAFRARGRTTYPINTVTTQRSGKTFQYGYFEARMKWTMETARGLRSGSFQLQHCDAYQDWCTTLAGEIDVMEGQGLGAQRVVRHDPSEHGESMPARGRPERQQLPARRRRPHRRLPHVSALFGRQPQSPGTWTTSRSWRRRRNASIDQRMFLLLQMRTGGWTKDPDATTPDVIETEVDWVRVWQQPG